MHILLETYAYAALAVLIYMSIFFLIGTALKNNGIVDVGWGLGFCVLAIVTLPQPYQGDRHWLMLAIVTLWAVRLSGFLFIRNVGKPEDFRYAQWRKEWGKWVVVRSFFQVYMLQGVFMLIIALPILLVNAHVPEDILDHFKGKIYVETNPYRLERLSIVEYIGAAIFLIGFYFEAVGDQQNFNFKKNPANKGKVMKYGLWRYTRHPNYFGETLIWWGIALVAYRAEYGYLAFISSAIITFLLLKVSGIPMLEKKYDTNPEYQEYKKHTSAFIPMPRKGN